MCALRKWVLRWASILSHLNLQFRIQPWCVFSRCCQLVKGRSCYMTLLASGRAITSKCTCMLLTAGWLHVPVYMDCIHQKDASIFCIQLSALAVQTVLWDSVEYCTWTDLLVESFWCNKIKSGAAGDTPCNEYKRNNIYMVMLYWCLCSCWWWFLDLVRKIWIPVTAGIAAFQLSKYCWTVSFSIQYIYFWHGWLLTHVTTGILLMEIW